MIAVLNFKHKSLIVVCLFLVCSVFVSVVAAQSWSLGSNWVVGSNWVAPLVASPSPIPTATPKPTVSPSPIVTPMPRSSTAISVDSTCVLRGMQFDLKTLNFTSASAGTIRVSINKNALPSLNGFVVYVNGLKTVYTYSSSNSVWVLTVNVK